MPSASGAELQLANRLRLADQDLKDAETLRNTGSRNATYHVEQAAEKLLHALWTSEGLMVTVNVSHRLDQLADGLPEAHPWRDALQRLSYLQSYATAYRYPTSGGRIPAGISPAREA